MLAESCSKSSAFRFVLREEHTDEQELNKIRNRTIVDGFQSVLEGEHDEDILCFLDEAGYVGLGRDGESFNYPHCKSLQARRSGIIEWNQNSHQPFPPPEYGVDCIALKNSVKNELSRIEHDTKVKLPSFLSSALGFTSQFGQISSTNTAGQFNLIRIYKILSLSGRQSEIGEACQLFG